MITDDERRIIVTKALDIKNFEKDNENVKIDNNGFPDFSNLINKEGD